MQTNTKDLLNPSLQKSESSQTIDDHQLEELPAQEQRKRRHSFRKGLIIGLILFMILFFVLPILVCLIGASLLGISYGPNNQKMIDLNSSRLEQGKTVNLAPAIFLMTMPPDYTIGSEDRQASKAIIFETISSKHQERALALMDKLQKYYPEGYYLITKAAIENPNEFKQLFELNTNSEYITADLLCHELSHLGLLRNGYWIEDKLVVIDNGFSLRKKLFSGQALLPYIDRLDRIDETYLKDDNQDLMTSMDEVNSYIKSVRIFRAFSSKGSIGTSSDPSTLARQLYIVSLHLKYAKEKDNEARQALVANKGLAYVLMRLTRMAEAEIAECKKDGLKDYKMYENMKLYEKNRAALDEYFSDTGVSGIKDLPLSLPQLHQRGINITIEIP